MTIRGVLGVSCLALVGACFQPQFSDHPSCDPETQACPAGERCLRGTCVSEGCAGAEDTTACANVNVPDGVCFHQSCVPVGCGDGILEAGEACDDGNLISGDGCSGDCKSNELCGNGFLDAITGEECDSGILGLSNDGCSSRCTVEVLDWRAFPASVVAPAINPLMAYDSDRGVTIAFGGDSSLADNSAMNQTVEYSGGNWAVREPYRSPPSAVGASMVYDARRHRAVLFSSAVWEYDGVTWAPGVAGSGGTGTPTFDRQRGVTVWINPSSLTTYDGSTWGQVATDPAPSIDGVLLYDTVHDCEWLLGSSEQWKLCGTTWTRMGSSVVTLAGASQIAYGRTCDCAVMFNGTSTWRFSGTTWSQLSVAGPPPRFNGWALTYDERRDRFVLFGGTDQSGRALNETWEFDGSTWAKQARATETAPFGGQLVFDPTRGRTILFDTTDVWESDGSSWSRRVSVHAAPGGAYAYFAPLGEVIAFNGATFKFDGVDWTPVATSQTPTGTGDYAMTYDAMRARLVLVDGGRYGLAETWEFDGTDWTHIAAARAPAAIDQSLAFDAGRGRVVLFGGSRPLMGGDSREDVNETWEYDGATWTKVAAVVSPSVREAALMAYDARRQRIVMYGGTRVIRVPVSSYEPQLDTWEWDGAVWTQRSTASHPAAAGSGIAFDSARSALVVVANYSTWSLSYASFAAPADVCSVAVDSDGDGLVGCADPDCAAFCTRCGDHMCDPALELAVCPDDCE